MWKWMVGIAAIPLGAAAVVAGVGALLPRDHVARAERVMAGSATQVAATVRNVEGYPRWRSGVDRIETLDRSGTQTRFVEHSGSDAIRFVLTEEVPERRFRSVIDDPELPFGGQWTIALEPVEQGTRVRIEENGFVSHPVYRFFSALVFGHEATMQAWLSDMERTLRR